MGLGTSIICLNKVSLVPVTMSDFLLSLLFPLRGSLGSDGCRPTSSYSPSLLTSTGDWRRLFTVISLSLLFRGLQSGHPGEGQPSAPVLPLVLQLLHLGQRDPDESGMLILDSVGSVEMVADVFLEGPLSD